MNRRNALIALGSTFVGGVSLNGFSHNKSVGSSNEGNNPEKNTLSQKENSHHYMTTDINSKTGLEIAEANITSDFNIPVSMEAKIDRQTISDNEPGSIGIKFHWRGGNQTSFSFGNSIPLTLPAYSDNETPGLLLLPPDHDIPRKNDTLWIPDVDGQLGVPLSTQSRKFDPGESITQELVVWGDNRYANQIQPGEYTFSSTFSKGGLLRTGDDSKNPTFNWELNIGITAPL